MILNEALRLLTVASIAFAVVVSISIVCDTVVTVHAQSKASDIAVVREAGGIVRDVLWWFGVGCRLTQPQYQEDI